MSVNSAFEVQPNMIVYTSDAAEIGRVKQIRDHDMLIDRESLQDIYIPLEYVDQVIDTEMRVELSLNERQYRDYEWETPPIL